MKNLFIMTGSHGVCSIAALLWILYLCLQTAWANVPTYILDEYCTNTLDMGIARISAGKLLLRRHGDSLRFPNCFMFIKAPANKMLTLKFHQFDIRSPRGCNDDHIQLFEDTRRQLPLTERLCNTNSVPDRVYTTSGEDATINLNLANFVNDQIELVFTAFTYAPCTGGEYECDNGRCIANELYCNGLDNCGDESDYCFLKKGAVIGSIVASVVVIVIIALIVAIYLFRRQRKIRREREKQFFSDLASNRAFAISNKSFLNDSDWDKRSFSDVSSMYSSNIRKQPSLLSKRDNQLRVIGYHANDGSRVSTLERYPVMHPYASEMASKVHYIVHDGGSRPSTLDRKLDRTDGKKVSTLERRTKSMDLRPPFFFDKDGYYTDTSIQHNHEDLYATPKKRKKKGGGKKAKGGLSRNASSVTTGSSAKLSPRVKSKTAEKDRLSEFEFHTSPVDYQSFENGASLTSHASTQMKKPVYANDKTNSKNPVICVIPPEEPVVKSLVKNVTPTVETVVNESAPSARNGFNDLPGVSTVSTSLHADINDSHSLGIDQPDSAERKKSQLSQSPSARQSALSVRHADGSPYRMHSVDLDQVEQPLKKHPEDGPNVVSFRSYFAPVPKEDHYVVRRSSKRSSHGK